MVGNACNAIFSWLLRQKTGLGLGHRGRGLASAGWSQGIALAAEPLAGVLLELLSRKGHISRSLFMHAATSDENSSCATSRLSPLPLMLSQLGS